MSCEGFGSRFYSNDPKMTLLYSGHRMSAHSIGHPEVPVDTPALELTETLVFLAAWSSF